ncbi:MAG: transposase [Oscillospiraceae bacterium]|nr:transposase [Oscillospiraceae bacterium]
MIGKYSRNTDGMEEKIFGLYACGMSQRDISEQIKSLYDVEISPELVRRMPPNPQEGTQALAGAEQVRICFSEMRPTKLSQIRYGVLCCMVEVSASRKMRGTRAPVVSETVRVWIPRLRRGPAAGGGHIGQHSLDLLRTWEGLLG